MKFQSKIAAAPLGGLYRKALVPVGRHNRFLPMLVIDKHTRKAAVFLLSPNSAYEERLNASCEQP